MVEQAEVIAAQDRWLANTLITLEVFLKQSALISICYSYVVLQNRTNELAHLAKCSLA